MTTSALLARFVRVTNNSGEEYEDAQVQAGSSAPSTLSRRLPSWRGIRWTRLSR